MEQFNQNDLGLNRYLAKTYGLMTCAVLISAITAWLMMTFFTQQLMGLLINHRWSVWFIILLPILLTLLINMDAMRSPGLGLALLIITAIIYGVTFSLIAGAYTNANLSAAFISAAAVFLTMAVIGTNTHRDFSRWGSYASAGLVGLIIALLVNLFLNSVMLTYVFSVVAVIIFTILTAWDAQRLKQLYWQDGGKSPTGLAIIGSLQLYLDFINLFISFLDIFSSANRD